MASRGETVRPQEVEKDFAYYVSRVRQATSLYDKAIENDTVGHENGMALINLPALEKCQEICSELLVDTELPPEHRILLNYYMSAQQDLHLSIIYLRCAMEVVEILEVVDGVVDPMREILETQLNDAMSRIYPPRSPEEIQAHRNRFIDCFPKNYSAPPIIRGKAVDPPLPSLRSGTMRREFPHYGRRTRYRTPADTQAQSANSSLRSSGPGTMPKRNLSYGRPHSPLPALQEAEPTSPSMPSPDPETTTLKHHLGDGLIFDTALLTKSITSGYGLNIAGIALNQPSIIVTDADFPDSRPTIIHRIQCATARRKAEIMERIAEGERD